MHISGSKFVKGGLFNGQFKDKGIKQNDALKYRNKLKEIRQIICKLIWANFDYTSSPKCYCGLKRNRL